MIKIMQLHVLMYCKRINENVDSPYYNLIKYPGNPRGKGKIDLSTVVSTLKKYVDVDGKL